MTALALGLLVIGAVFVVASFFLAEKISPKELTKMAELSEKELKTLMEKELDKAEGRVEDAIDSAIDGSLIKVERALDKETNEKIMAINEYSDTVMTDLNKTREEVLFLYSMLNDRHDELTKTAGDVRNLIRDVSDRKEPAAEPVLEPMPEPVPEILKPEAVSPEGSLKPEASPEEKTAGAPMQDRRTRAVLELTEAGKTEVEIAQELHMGVGEVRLIRNLSRPRSEATPSEEPK